MLLHQQASYYHRPLLLVPSKQRIYNWQDGSTSVISKVFRQIAYLIKCEAKENEDIDNNYKGKTDKNGNNINKTNAVQSLKLEHIDVQLIS